ncbi:hypothetical protein Ae201684_016323 [Aphanomyces euteiches]|uniref:Uncharacterized protein n=1 Tax=Aphanomyces euteiches TaxID=100861 RepID=A0A6G0WCX1_9STRA|nr:hypothetical protein Ae201684_016323 [Aphanomyces euteiches]
MCGIVGSVKSELLAARKGGAIQGDGQARLRVESPQLSTAAGERKGSVAGMDRGEGWLLGCPRATPSVDWRW